ncbi:putative ribonuclease H-like domain-containing protein [Tanacetum coccineum]|uniref:Ribonuclease H-like domain-containing protein n=1 Tax=Tanacetum coccineum TaxID=301880 RepID=A0ABQ5ITN9_9ASTR
MAAKGDDGGDGGVTVVTVASTVVGWPELAGGGAGKVEKGDEVWQVSLGMIICVGIKSLLNTVSITAALIDVNAARSKNLTVNWQEQNRFDKSKVECYNCHKRGHFAKECRASRNQDNKNKESSRKNVPMETSTSTALVSCDSLGGYDWSDQAEEGPNYALMAYSSSSFCIRFPPPYTGNFMPPTPDLSFTGLDEFVNEPAVENYKAMSSEEEPKVVRKNDDALIIEECVSDDEEEDVSQPKIEKKIVRPNIVKKEFVKSKQQEKTTRKTVKQEVIINGDSPLPKRIVNGVEQTYPPTTAEEKLARNNDLKARGTLLMALPNEHQLKFNTYKSFKTLMEAIEKRLEVIKESKKTLRESDYSNEKVREFQWINLRKDLFKTYDRPQKLISPARDSARVLSLQTESNDDVVTIHLFANQSNSPQLDNEDLEQIDADDLEEMDLKWQMAMLTMRAKRFLNKTGMKISSSGSKTIRFNKSKVECYNCHKKDQFTRECRALRENRNREPVRRNVTVETTETNALVTQDGLGNDWSDQAEERPKNFALMAYTSSGAYKASLESIEARLDVYKKNEVVFEEDIKILKLDIMLRDNALTELRKKFEKAEKERDDLKLTLEKFENSSKNLSKLLEIQNMILPESITGVPAVATSKVNTSESKPKSVIEPLIEDWIFDNEESVEKEKGVIDNGCSRHMTGSMSYLSDYEEIDGGFVAFGRDPKGGKITSKGKITTGIENLIDLKVKVIRCDIGTEFKNKVMNQFCEMKGIKREFSFARTPQQNGVAERKNRTLIEAARIMLADSKLLTTFWAEAVNTACYVQNKVLVIKPHNKTPYELFLDALTKSMNYEPVVAGNQSNGIVDPNMLNLEEIIYSEDDEGVGAEADMNNLDTFRHVIPILTTRIHKDHPFEQIIRDLYSTSQTRRMTKSVTEHIKSAFLYGKIEKEVYVYQPPGFKDPKFSDRVYKVEKSLYGLHQAPKACQDKYVDEILKKFGFSTVKTTSTPMETSNSLIKDENAKDVDVHLYRSMIGSLMYLTSSRPVIMFDVCACLRFQVTPKVSHLHAVKRIFRYLKGQPKLCLWYPKDSSFDLEAYSDSDYQTIVATSTTEAEYVVATNCCGQVLWIQNQMLDYGYSLMNTKIFIDNESTICIVKNPVFELKTKHIEIKHHFIRGSYEKRLIQVIKIHTDHNVADLLTKALDVSRFQFLTASIGMLNL